MSHSSQLLRELKSIQPSSQYNLSDFQSSGPRDPGTPETPVGRQTLSQLKEEVMKDHEIKLRDYKRENNKIHLGLQDKDKEHDSRINLFDSIFKEDGTMIASVAQEGLMRKLKK